MAQYTQDELVGAATAIAQAMNKLNDRLNDLESRPAADEFRRSVQDGHRFLRSKGLSNEQIERGETRMAAEAANYQRAYADGLFGKGRIVLGGIPADELKMYMDGDDEGASDLGIERALDEVRNGG